MSNLDNMLNRLAKKKVGHRGDRSTRNRRLLDKNRIRYENHDNGNRLVIDGTIDFWPATGRFLFREHNIKGKGAVDFVDLYNELYETTLNAVSTNDNP